MTSNKADDEDYFTKGTEDENSMFSGELSPAVPSYGKRMGGKELTYRL